MKCPCRGKTVEVLYIIKIFGNFVRVGAEVKGVESVGYHWKDDECDGV